MSPTLALALKRTSFCASPTCCAAQRPACLFPPLSFKKRSGQREKIEVESPRRGKPISLDRPLLGPRRARQLGSDACGTKQPNCFSVKSCVLDGYSLCSLSQANQLLEKKHEVFLTAIAAPRLQLTKGAWSKKSARLLIPPSVRKSGTLFG